MLETGAQTGRELAPVVLLGHTGFIGQRLYAALARETGRRISVFSSQTADLTQKSGCARLEPVLTPATSLIWLAAVKRQQGDSLATLETNLQICLNLAEMLVRKPVRQVIFLSSTAVYGEDVAYAEPIDEATPPQPTSYYGMAKVFSEQILTKACAALPQTSLLILRPPLVYGPGEARPSYGPNLFSLALKQAEPALTLWGQGEELREFLHVDDLVGLIRALLDKPLSGTLNAVSGQSHAFQTVVETLSELSQRRVALSYRARTKACVDHRFDPARLRQALPEFRFRSLREGLLSLLAAPNDCRLCGAAAETLLDFGPQPLSNRYPSDAAQPEPTFGMALRLCRRCGVTQLGEVPPLAMLEDHPAWITYREAEHHLDRVASLLAELRPLAGLKVRGLSFKDEPLIEGLRQAGASDARCYTSAELGCGGGIESIQGRLDSERAEQLIATDGECDLLLARHILEHAQNLPEFLQALRRLLKPEGRLLLELPDSERSLAQKDYSMPWEEHVFYFTPQTLAQVWRCCGWEPVASARFGYQPEDVLVTVLAPADVSEPMPAPESMDLAKAYGAGLAASAAAYREALAQQRRSRGPVALLGGGHLGCTFINLLGLADCLDCVIDDDPNKQGLLMPGSRLPILPSSALAERGIKLCLLSINPDSEARVIARFRELTEQGLIFASIFPGSPYKLELDDRGLA